MDSKTHNIYIGRCSLLIMDRPSFTIDEQYFICRAINLYGDELDVSMGWITPETFDFATRLDYVERCVSQIPNDDLTEEGLVLKQKILEKIK